MASACYMITADRRCEDVRMIQPRMVRGFRFLRAAKPEAGGIAGKVVLSR